MDMLAKNIQTSPNRKKNPDLGKKLRKILWLRRSGGVQSRLFAICDAGDAGLSGGG
jgi:hypothetical protein